MVWVYDLRFEIEGGGSGFGHVHGVGQVHAYEGHVYILEATHFGNTGSIAREINVLVAKHQHITVAAAFRVFGVGGFGQVIHRHSFYNDVELGGGFGVVQYNRFCLQVFGHLVGNSLRNDNHRAAGGYGLEYF